MGAPLIATPSVPGQNPTPLPPPIVSKKKEKSTRVNKPIVLDTFPHTIYAVKTIPKEEFNT